MKITEIYITCFGKLRGVKIPLVDGVNIIYGENESGKSTVMAFILGMLYGLGKGEQRRKYDPWSGGRMAGILSFEHGGKAYTLTRQFGVTKAADKTELWCTTTGEQVDVPDKKEPGEFLMGINRETFVNSVYIGQVGTPIQGENNEILAKLTNLAASGDETASRTEITARLSEAAACLRSKRASAIIPGLEKQRLELLEQRAGMVQEIKRIDELRESVSKLASRKKHLANELEVVEKQTGLIDDVKKLSSFDLIISKHASLEESRKKYETLHNVMFGGDGAIDSEFLDSARRDLESYRSQQTVIRMKQEQLEACDDRLDSIDRSCLANMRTVKRHSDEIADAFDEYSELRTRRMQVERQMEKNRSDKKKDGLFSLNNVAIMGSALIIGLVLLGIAWHGFFVVAALAAVALGAYIFVQKKGIGFEGVPQNNIELENLLNDMRDVNRRMRPILDEMGVGGMEELDRELHEMDRVSNQIVSATQEKETVMEEIADLRQDLENTMAELKEKLKPYKNVESDAEAVKIISALDKAQRDHAALEAQYNAEKSSFDEALSGRDYDQICTEAADLREKLGDKAELGADGMAEQELSDRIEDISQEIEEVKTELIKKETELDMQTVNQQELNGVNEKIKLLAERIDKYDFEYCAIREAQDALDEAFESMQKDFGPMINYRAGKIMNELTGGKYSSVIISEALVPSVAEQGESDIRSCQSLSSGTVDQIYLSLRLAIAGILGDETLPILLDDALCQYDDKRMTDALYYLGKESGGELGQVVLFTCHDGLVKTAKSIGINEGYISLGGKNANG